MSTILLYTIVQADDNSVVDRQETRILRVGFELGCPSAVTNASSDSQFSISEIQSHQPL